MVSEKMNLLGRSHQIICITHLPQIAAMADAHYLIEKAVSNGATVSKIRRLDTAETVDELSRMLFQKTKRSPMILPIIMDI